MARGSDLLDDKTVKAKTAPGHYRDGRGLFCKCRNGARNLGSSVTRVAASRVAWGLGRMKTFR